jgi:fimbrial chaperone protein
MRVLRSLLGLVALTACCGPAMAGSLRVMPIRVEVAAGRQFCSLTIGNDADRPVTVQVRGFGWTRDETGADVLDPATGPVVNPAIATIAPGASRLVRCSLPASSQAPGGTEEQWRLIVDELPSTAPDVAAGTIQTLLRLSIPVFRAAPGMEPRLGWLPAKTPAGLNAMRLENSGTRHAQVMRLVLHEADGSIRKVGRGFYLLPSGALLLPVEMTDGSAPVEVTAETDIGAFRVARLQGQRAPGAIAK